MRGHLMTGFLGILVLAWAVSATAELPRQEFSWCDRGSLMLFHFNEGIEAPAETTARDEVWPVQTSEGARPLPLSMEKGAAWAPGKFGTGIRFATPESVAATGNLDPKRNRLLKQCTDGFIVQCWVDWEGPAADQRKQTLFTNLMCPAELSIGRDQALTLSVTTTAGVFRVAGKLPQKAWTFVDARLENGMLSLSVDGVRLQQQSVAGAVPLAEPWSLRIGNDKDGKSSFNGTVDEFRMLTIVPDPMQEKAPATVSSFFQEDFEKEARTSLLATNAKYTLHFNGLTGEQAFTGGKSFKLDATLEDGHYFYWRGDAVNIPIPSQGGFYLAGAFLPSNLPSDTVTITPGCQLVYPKDPGYSKWGRGVSAEKINAASDNWIPFTVNIRAAVDEDKKNGVDTTGAYVQYWTFSFQSGKFLTGGSHVTVYIDSIQLTDSYPKMLFANSSLRKIQNDLAALQASLERSALPAAAKQRLSGDRKRLIDKAAAVGREITGRPIANREQMAPYLARLQTLEEDVEQQVVRFSIEEVRQAAGNRYSNGIVPFVQPPFEFSTTRTPLKKEWLGTAVRIRGCRGEYVPASFGIATLRPVPDVRVAAVPLAGSAGSIPASALNLKVVKSWYQAGFSAISVGVPVFVPELLVTDDRIELNGPEPDVKFPDSIQTSADPDSLKRFWLTCHIPGEAAAGIYRGEITLTGKGADSIVFPVELTVLPFDLAAHGRDYQIFNYYPPKMSEELFRVYINDWKEHGINGAAVYGTPPGIYRYLTIMKEEGFTSYKLLAGYWQHAAEIEKWRKERGFPDFEYWLADEPAGDKIVFAMDNAIKTKEAGGRTTSCINEKASGDALGPELLDVPVWSICLTDYLQDLATGREKKRYLKELCYWQDIVEDPRVNRFTAGFWLWKVRLDGAQPFPYGARNPRGNPYDDWNPLSGGLRGGYDIVYPLKNGIIPTIQWEALREGITDMRYIVTLEQKIEEAVKNQVKRPQGEAARLVLNKIRDEVNADWLQAFFTLTVHDLDRWRSTVADAILKLEEQ